MDVNIYKQWETICSFSSHLAFSIDFWVWQANTHFQLQRQPCCRLDQMKNDGKIKEQAADWWAAKNMIDYITKWKGTSHLTDMFLEPFFSSSSRPPTKINEKPILHYDRHHWPFKCRRKFVICCEQTARDCRSSRRCECDHDLSDCLGMKEESEVG